MRVHMRVSGNEALTVREFEAEDLTRNSMSCGEDVFFHKFPHDLHRRLALLPQSYYPLSHISTQTARHTFRLQEDDTRNVAWSTSTISHYIISTYSHVYTYVTRARARYMVITFERHSILGTYGIHVVNTYVPGYVGLGDCVSLIHF